MFLGHLGGLAQLARAPALQAGGHRFESDILHYCGIYFSKFTIFGYIIAASIFDILTQAKL